MKKHLLCFIIFLLTLSLYGCSNEEEERDENIIGGHPFEELHPTLMFQGEYYEWYEGRPRLLEKSEYYGELTQVKGDVPTKDGEIVFPFDVAGEIYTVPGDSDWLYVVVTSEEGGYDNAVAKFQRVEESELKNLVTFQIQDNMNLALKDPDDENYFPETVGNGCLRSVYNSPKDVDLYELFYDGFEFEIENPDFYLFSEEVVVKDEDIAFLEEQGAPMDLKILKLPGERIEEYLQKYMGLTLEETNKVGLEKFYYNEDTDTYYLVHEDDTHYKYVNVVEQFIADDMWCFVYTLKESEDAEEESEKFMAVMKIEPQGGYHASNKKYSDFSIFTLYMRAKKWLGLVE